MRTVYIYIYVYSLVTKDTGLPSATPLLREIEKAKPVTIAKLNNFAIPAVSHVYSLPCCIIF